MEDAPLIDIRLLDEPACYVPLAHPVLQPSGGECVFLGRTRQETHADHGELRRLSYEAYRSMAPRVLRDLAERAVQEYGCRLVRLHHTVGEVPLGEASVFVQVLCPHRGEAFAACRFLIDALKSEAPIWKREEWADGSTWSEGQARAQAPRRDDADGS